MVRELSPDKREKLMSTALRLFAAQGVQNTPTAQIAREAGTAAGTLFLYFPTKQDLVHALVFKIGQESAEYIRPRMEPSLPAEESFYAIWNGLVSWFLANLEAYAYVQQVREARIVSEDVAQATGQFLEYFPAAYHKGLQSGTIKPYPLELVGEVFYCDIVAVMNILRRQPERERRDEMIRNGFDIFWDGIRR